MSYTPIVDYCTPVDIRARMPTIANPPNTDAALQPFCDQVSTRIDAALRKRYVVPFVAPFDPLLIRIATDLATALVAVILYGGDGTKEEPTLGKTLRVQALADLKELATRDPQTGEYSLSLAAVELSVMTNRSLNVNTFAAQSQQNFWDWNAWVYACPWVQRGNIVGPGGGYQGWSQG